MPFAEPPVWTAPVTPIVVVRRFHVDRARPFAAGAHRGIDLRGAPGAEVRAPCNGTVSFRGAVAGRAALTITCIGGWKATLGGVRTDVAPGTAVQRGGVLGHAAGATLELSARDPAGSYRDPAPLLRAPRERPSAPVVRPEPRAARRAPARVPRRAVLQPRPLAAQAAAGAPVAPAPAARGGLPTGVLPVAALAAAVLLAHAGRRVRQARRAGSAATRASAGAT